MKKTLFAIAMLAVALVACEKGPSEGAAKLDATIALAEGVEATLAEGVAYGSPLAIKGTVTTTAPLTEVVLTGVAKNGNAYAAKGSAQTLEQDGNEVDVLWFADTKEATHVEVKLVAGDKAATFYYAVGAVEGEWNYGAWCEPTAVLKADGIIANSVNAPETYPEANTGAGSDTPSFISMNGVNVNGTLKHIVSLNEILPGSGENASFCWANVYKSTDKLVTLTTHRGYVLCDIQTISAGSIGRQCDLAQYGEYKIDQTKADVAKLSRIVGSWAGKSYDEKEYAFVDSLFLAIPEKMETLADQMRAFYQLSEIQKVLDNSTLGVEEEPTNLTNTNMYRRYANAAKGITAENFRAGDYLIMRYKGGTAEAPVYTYGIIQIVQLYDDTKDFAVNADGLNYIDTNKTENLFYQPNYFNIKCQMVVK